MIQKSLAAANGHFGGRAYVPELASPYPLGDFLPGIYHLSSLFGGEPNMGDVPFALRMTAALDLVLAPIFSSLDNFDAYLDPQLAPADFLDWLGTWMGLVADETWPIERRRDFISRASELYRIRGTPKGLASHVQLFTGGEVEVLERGATAWSTESGAELPGSPGFDMIVKIVVEDPAGVDVDRVNALVAVAKPAHLAHTVEVAGKEAPVPSPESALTTDGSPEVPQTESTGDGSEPTSG